MRRFSTKAVLALALALVMALACVVPGIAAETSISYDGDSVSFIKEDGSQFGMFTPQDGTTVKLDGDTIAIHFVPKNTTVYNGIHFGFIDDAELTADVAANEDGTFDITLSADKAGTCIPVAPIKAKDGGTTKDQYYLAIPAAEKLSGGTVKCVVSPQKLTVNGVEVECAKYNINRNNYFKLRDLAALLDGTPSQFNVEFDADKKEVYVTTGEHYEKLESDLKVDEDLSAKCKTSVWKLFVDGEEQEVSVYNIGGNNFFKLRDVNHAIGFYVHYDKATNTAIVEEQDEEEDWTTGDASADKIRNEDGIGEKELLVVSFGTSYNDSRVATIGAIEQAMEDAFPELSVRRGFTANIVIDHIYAREDMKIDDLEEALDRAVANGVKELYVQPTHLMAGYEYDDVQAAVAKYADSFEKIALGKQMLDTDEDFEIVMKAITEATAAQAAEADTAICFMGHGTEHASNAVYAKLQEMLKAAGYDNYYVGTVEAEPSFQDVVDAVKAAGYKKVYCEPLMIVAGDHANNDMADPEDPESWVSLFAAAGIEAEPILRGLGELPAIQELLVEHAKAMIEGEEEEEEENYETGDASLDDPRNADGIGANELLVVSFGTSYNDSRRLTIGAIEQAMEDAFPGFDVRRGFTANIVIDHVARRDGEIIDDLDEALQRAVDNGVKNLIVQPTHLMAGYEYDDVVAAVAKYADSFDVIGVGKQLLDTDEDFETVMKAITEATAEQAAEADTAICFMGHGTEHASNAVYAKLQEMLKAAGYDNYYVGTVEAEPSFQDVVEAVKAAGYKKVYCEPLMIVAGDHANNDMADPEDPESWVSLFAAAGIEAEPILRGLGELPAIQELLVAHAKAAMEEYLEEDFETGDATLDNPRNADGIGEKELLVVSFGTSYNDSRVATIGAIEQAMVDAFPELSIRRGFTANIVIDHIYRRDGEVIDDLEEALERAVANGVKELYVQPTHLMAGYEYDDVVAAVAKYADSFDKVEVGKQILDTDKDFETVRDAIVEATEEYNDGKTAICFMGHGTEHASNAVYAKLQTLMPENYFIGTVEATPSVDDVLALVQAGDYERVVLRPLMIVAGDHANNDMADEEDPESWVSVFKAAGYENVECVIEGLGQLPAIQQLLVAHAMVAVNGRDINLPTRDVSPAQAEQSEVVEEGMVPVTADKLVDGTYDVTVMASSSMFKIKAATLTVADGKMTLDITVGTAYTWMFMGGGDDVADADDSEFIPAVTADGIEGNAFTLPVEALDDGILCCAYSKNKDAWYERTLLVRADSLPDEAFAEALGTDPATLNLADGEYTVAVALGGGSGKTSITSPAKLVVADGKLTASIVFSSSKYDYAKLGDVQYDAVTTDPGSTFEIPVTALDRNLPFIGHTTAMGGQEISYTLNFESASIVAAA